MSLPRPSDAEWLAAAARLASRARPLSRPNPGVGAIIVKHGKVIGRGWTQPGGRPHAEAMALAKMDWNNDALYDPLPVTIMYSQRLSRTISNVPSLPGRSYPYRLFM